MNHARDITAIHANYSRLSSLLQETRIYVLHTIDFASSS
jgi:hypothetical protein